MTLIKTFYEHHSQTHEKTFVYCEEHHDERLCLNRCNKTSTIVRDFQCMKCPRTFYPPRPDAVIHEMAQQSGAAVVCYCDQHNGEEAPNGVCRRFTRRAYD